MQFGLRRRLIAKLVTYHQFHRNRWNRTLHAVGVPLITYAVLLAGTWVRVTLAGGFDVSLAAVLVALVLVGYASTDGFVALLVAVVSVSFLASAEVLVGRRGFDGTWPICVAIFVTGWAIQFAGHAIEGRRPAFTEDVSQLLVAPFYLGARAAFGMGRSRALRRDVQRTLEEREGVSSPH